MTDEEIVDEVLKGNTSLFNILYKKYCRLVYRYAFKKTFNAQDAEDLSQEIFLHLFKNLHTYNSQYKFFTWMYVNIKYRSADNIKKMSKHSDSSLDLLTAEFFRSSLLRDERQNIEEQFEIQEQRNMLEKAILKLTPSYGDLVRMRFIEGLSYKEMSERTGKDYFTVKQMTYIGRNNLSRVLQNKDRPKVEKRYDREGRGKEYVNKKINGIIKTTRTNKKRIKVTEEETAARKAKWYLDNKERLDKMKKDAYNKKKLQKKEKAV